MNKNTGYFVTYDDIDKRYTIALLLLSRQLEIDVEDVNEKIDMFLEMNHDLEVKTIKTH